MSSIAVDLGLTEAESAAMQQTKRTARSRGHISPWLFTPHQARILDALIKDSRAKMIARSIGVPDGTIRSHVFRICNRMGATTMVRAAVLYDRWLRLEAERAAQGEGG